MTSQLDELPKLKEKYLKLKLKKENMGSPRGRVDKHWFNLSLFNQEQEDGGSNLDEVRKRKINFLKFLL